MKLGKNCDLEVENDDNAHNPAFDACLTAHIFLNISVISAKVETRCEFVLRIYIVSFLAQYLHALTLSF
jgi:hypothetical protein